MYNGFSQEKRLSKLSNKSHDSQASSSTASATSQDEKRGVNSTAVGINNGHGQEEEELDEMEVEYTEVCLKDVQHILECNCDLYCTCASYCKDNVLFVWECCNLFPFCFFFFLWFWKIMILHW